MCTLQLSSLKIGKSFDDVGGEVCFGDLGIGKKRKKYIVNKFVILGCNFAYLE
jgi:hypothetical protein